MDEFTDLSGLRGSNDLWNEAFPKHREGGNRCL